MNRWNISHVIYYSKHGQKRVLEFEPGNVTIITGASSTGKTYIINTIDYCLCSSDINLSNFVKKRVTHVAVKWVKKNTEILVAREISQHSSSSGKMFIEIGNKIIIPDLAIDLKGSVNERQARNMIAQRFGLIDFKSYEEDIETNISNVSIRQLTPYIFLDKEVIDSKKLILHGLDDPNEAKHIIASLPYFLNAIDIEELQEIKKLKGLKKGIENEEKKKLISEQYQSESLEKCKTLYNEAIQAGLLKNIEIIEENSLIIKALKSILDWQPSKIIFENEELLNDLENKKTSLLSEVKNLRRKRKAAVKHNTVNTDFENISDKQITKLDISNIFKFTDGNCPLCDSHLEGSKEASKLIETSFQVLKEESKVVDEYRPKLDNYIIEIDKKIDSRLILVSSYEKEIQNLIKESEVAKKQKAENNTKLRVLGRISYFLDNLKEIEDFKTKKLDQYIQEYEDINKKYGVAQREEKIQDAERLISNLATKNLAQLPIAEIYKGDSINFISKKTTITLTNPDTGDVEKFPGIGSDENYLSIHTAFSFAFHKFFEIMKSPVPGILILDQVSRPYYPKDQDLDIIDEDREALEQHFNFIFDQVEKQNGLQVIVLEHAYLHKNERYKKAVKYRWPRDNTSERLIPPDWPVE